jgi:hypothetical protein
LAVSNFLVSQEGLLVFDNKEKERYTAFELIVKRVRAISLRVTFLPGQEPLQPFSLLRPDAFQAHAQDFIPAKLPEADERVDNELSCRSCYKCIAYCAPRFLMCAMHTKRMHNLLALEIVSAQCLDVAGFKELTFHAPV